LLTGGYKLHYYPPQGVPFSLINHYGPTEYTVVTTTARIDPSVGATTDPPIGRPIANTQVYLLDDHLNPVPIGVGGELYIGGDGLARGYLNRPDLTADRFIPDPFSPNGSNRLYRTGDIARYLADGRVDYIGRIDHQVKVRGYRIEMGEIEDVICRIEGVNRAVVVVADDAKAGKQILAFVVEEAGSGLGVEQMRREARKKLPEYMMPARWVKLDDIPQTPNGKVDRAELIKMAGSITETGSGMQRARTPVEEMVSEIWKEVLGRESL
jgi:acyl-coenzyme A synthetase/AMP-(fatty) acid ligase